MGLDTSSTHLIKTLIVFCEIDNTDSLVLEERTQLDANILELTSKYIFSIFSLKIIIIYQPIYQNILDIHITYIDIFCY